MIQRRLLTDTFGKQLVVFETCNSTNDVGEQFALTGAPHGLVVIAAVQTRGRGRFSREWVSPKGGLWMTVLLRKPELSAIAGTLPLLGALAVTRVLNASFQVKAQVR